MSIDLNTDIQSAKVAKRGRAKLSLNSKRSEKTAPAAVAHAPFAGGPFDTDARRAMIAEGAYHLAAQRGFAPGHELEDWLAAESEVDARLYGETHPF